MNNVEYWAQRAILQEQRVHDMGDKMLSNLQVEYNLAQKELQGQIGTWYQKYADENGISVAQARKKLTAKEQKQYQASIETFITQAKTDDKRLNASLRQQYIASRVNRLQALENQVAVQLALLGKRQDAQTFQHLQRTYQDTYYRTMHAAGQAGLISRFDRLNPNVVEQICRTPWSGKDFSERIWGNNDKLIKEVRHILSNGAITGAGVDKMARQLAKRMDVSYNRAENLIRTESAFVREQATADIYAAAGLKQYEYMATLDKRTSWICRSLDNEVFTMVEKMVGVNYPPMHPRCRSTTVPFFDDEWTQSEQRFARDRNGKGIYVDAKMNYEQWHQQYIASGNVATNVSLFLGNAIYATLEQRGMQQAADEFAMLPETHQQFLMAHIDDIRDALESPYVQHRQSSHYDYINRVVYLRKDLTDGELIHELGHVWEYELDIFNNDRFLAVVGSGLDDYGRGNIAMNSVLFGQMVILADDNGKFISDYQRFVNIDRAYLIDGKLNPQAMTEYLAEGYRAYFREPDLLKAKDQQLYDYIEKELGR